MIRYDKNDNQFHIDDDQLENFRNAMILLSTTDTDCYDKDQVNFLIDDVATNFILYLINNVSIATPLVYSLLLELLKINQKTIEGDAGYADCKWRLLVEWSRENDSNIKLVLEHVFTQQFFCLCSNDLPNLNLQNQQAIQTVTLSQQKSAHMLAEHFLKAAIEAVNTKLGNSSVKVESFKGLMFEAYSPINSPTKRKLKTNEVNTSSKTVRY